MSAVEQPSDTVSSATEPNEIDPVDEIATLQAQLAIIQTQADEHLQSLQRERADFSNFRRRTESQQALANQLAAARALQDFLPVLDDLELALRAIPDTPENAKWLGGFRMVLRKSQGVLERQGIQVVSAEPGQEFDPNLHEGILQSDSTEFESGQIMNVLRQGYKVGDRILRPAQVQIAR
jgi:molecular chaperone GrpE